MANFIDKYKKDFQQVSQIDREIRQYIVKSHNDDFHEVLSKTNNWYVFLQLSKLRRALLSWYEFKSQADILEIAAGFGTLTGFLCEVAREVTVAERSTFRAKSIVERYKNLKNLEVYAGDFCEIVFEKKFDYIILSGILELQGEGKAEKKPYIEYLKKAKYLLKPGGKLLLAIENRYGLKYFCGEVEPYTKEFFAGINKYPELSRGYCFDRQEIISILEKAELSDYKFYYPVPDYKLPQVIYSENHLPGQELRERIIPYYNSNSIIASESLLYSDIVRNNVFPFFANSFFIECGTKIDFCPVDYAAITIDRGLETSFITSIYGERFVKKQPLYKEGEYGLWKLQKQMQDLGKRQIKTVSTELKNKALYMPYIKALTLADYLRSLTIKDKDEIFCIFDKLWMHILQSSEITEEIDEELLQYAPKIEWGPVLKCAYLEMIPMNCFYKNKEMIFFDQEFVKMNYPAKYPMFRAIAFIYQELKDIVSLEELRQRYKIDEKLWSNFALIESQFFSELRNTDVYHQFYSKRENPERIKKNRTIMSLLN